MNSSGALWKIPIENSIGDSLCNWHDEQCSQFTNEFTDGIYSIGNFVCKNDTSSFFFALFYFFSHCNSLGISVCIYRFSDSGMLNYCNRVEGFINYVLCNPRNISGGSIRCLCKRCKNKKFLDSNVVTVHLL